MNDQVRAGAELARRILDAHTRHINSLQGEDRVAFLAGFGMGMLGAMAHFIGAAATIPMLEIALEQARTADASDAATEH